MNKKINEIKDLVYETEGLLELLQLRGDKLTELRPLVLARMDEARRLLCDLGEIPCENAHIESEPDTIAVQQTVDEMSPVIVPESGTIQDTERKNTNPRLLKPTFCLNDRFRFKRSIFGGSNADFDAAMDHLTTLDNYEEAEELFYGDMELNPEDPDVIDFMNVLKEYFEQ